MIQIKTDEDIEMMRESAELAAEVLLMIEPYVKPGVDDQPVERPVSRSHCLPRCGALSVGLQGISKKYLLLNQ